MKKWLLPIALLFFVALIPAFSEGESSDLGYGEDTQSVLTRGDAITVLIREVIDPSPNVDFLVAYGLQGPLSPEDVLQSFLPRDDSDTEASIGDPYDQGDAWFFWIDDSPWAAFAHPTRFVLIDRATGSVEVTYEEWWPVINGNPYWDAMLAFESSTDVIFQGIYVEEELEWLEQTSLGVDLATCVQPPVRDSLNQGKLFALASTSLRDVMGSVQRQTFGGQSGGTDSSSAKYAILVRGTPESAFTNSYTYFQDLLIDLGFKKENIQIVAVDTPAATQTSLKKAFDQILQKMRDDKTVNPQFVFYYVGHGNANGMVFTQNGCVNKEEDAFDYTPRSNKPGVLRPDGSTDRDTLAGNLILIPSTTITVVLDACKSGSAICALRGVGLKGYVLTAADTTGESKGALESSRMFYTEKFVDGAREGRSLIAGHQYAKEAAEGFRGRMLQVLGHMNPSDGNLDSSYANNVLIKGEVVDQDGNPIKDATVDVIGIRIPTGDHEPDKRGDVTDSSGSFSVEFNFWGNFTIEASKLCYTTYNQAISLTRSLTGLTYTLKRDTTPPTIQLSGDPVVDIPCGGLYHERGAEVLEDTCAPGIPTAVVIGGDRIDTAKPGTYVVTYDATDCCGNAAAQVKRTVNVVVLKLCTDVESLDFGAQDTKKTVTVWACRDGKLSYEIKSSLGWSSESLFPEEQKWLIVSAQEGESTGPSNKQTITVTVERKDLDPGEYKGEITISSSSTQEPWGTTIPVKTVTIPVTMTIVEPDVCASTYDLNFGEIIIETEKTLEIWNCGGGIVDFEITIPEDDKWLTVHPTGGRSEGENSKVEVAVTVDPSKVALTNNEYTSRLTISWAELSGERKERKIEVKLVVPPPKPCASVEGLEFKPSETKKAFEVWNCGGGTLDFTIFIPESSRTWLKADPASGTSTGHDEEREITVTVDRSKMSDEDYGESSITVSPGVFLVDLILPIQVSPGEDTICKTYSRTITDIDSIYDRYYELHEQGSDAFAASNYAASSALYEQALALVEVVLTEIRELITLVGARDEVRALLEEAEDRQREAIDFYAQAYGLWSQAGEAYAEGDEAWDEGDAAYAEGDKAYDKGEYEKADKLYDLAETWHDECYSLYDEGDEIFGEGSAAIYSSYEPQDEVWHLLREVREILCD